MFDTLQKLKSGQLKGAKELRLNGLEIIDFPIEILELAETLTLLDLSNNRISSLPKEFSLLVELKIVFLSLNQFEIFPEVLGQLTKLEMVGFKSNQINFISENALPPKLKWLILTHNQLSQLPKSIGSKNRLQKCMLAGNNLTSLPEEMKNCVNLELLRISANRLNALPEWIWNLPRLTWLAYSSNNFNSNFENFDSIKTYAWESFGIENQLGEGASGVISKATFKTKNIAVAIKVFKGEVTSDGLPKNEMIAAIHAGIHPNLIRITGKIMNHPQQKDGLVMELLSPNFYNLAEPPTFETCTRDVFKKEIKYSLAQVIIIIKQVAEACFWLHSKKVLHGDLYAHNILIDQNLNTKISDFGAATIYKENSLNHEKLEVRAWGCLLEDLLENTVEKNNINLEILNEMIKLKTDCLHEKITRRPSFDYILKTIDRLI